MLKKQFSEDFQYEIGIDEVGRGPLFGSVYASAVILPRDSEIFEYKKIKDSKKFSSEKKREKISQYIKENSIAWSIGYATSEQIDEINIKQATYLAMHNALDNLLSNFQEITDENTLLLVDGNDFKQYKNFKHECVIKGDSTYYSIAAASVVAKVERDAYIYELCKKEPELDMYMLKKNKGYGTKQHLDAINKYGISKYHRQTFGSCKNKKLN